MPTRRVSIVPVVVATVVAGSFASCGDATEPEHAVQITATTPTALTGTVGAEVQPAPSVRATDENDRPLAGVAITFKVASGGGTVSAGPVTTRADGSATLGKWTLGPTVGTQTLTAGAGGKAEVVFAAVAGAGPVAQIAPASGNNQLAGIGQVPEQPLVALAADAFGNPVAGVAVAFTVTAGGGSIDGAAVVTDSAGLATAKQWRLGAEAGVQQVAATSGAARAGFRAYAVEPPGELQGQIAFTSWAAGADNVIRNNVAVVNADGSGRTELIHPGRGISPAWSPDGSLIAFAPDAPDENDEPYGIGLMRADGSSLTWMVDHLFALEPAWSPSGEWIAFSTGGTESGIYSVSVAYGWYTSLVAALTNDRQPAWSPDGQKLAFVSRRAGASDIYIANADGTGQTRLTDGSAGSGPERQFLRPAWSPDGSMIAFVYGDDVAGGDTAFRVAVMTTDGVFLKDLASAGVADGTPPNAGSLAWSPDGTGIVYTFRGCDSSPPVDCRSGHSVRYVSLDGSRQLTIVNDAQSPTWRR